MTLNHPSPALLMADLKGLAIRAHQTSTRACAEMPTDPQGTDTIGQEQRVLVERNAGVSLPDLARERYRETRYRF
jgi:hypothetical protein